MPTEDYPIEDIEDFEASPAHTIGDEEFGGPPAFEAKIRLIRSRPYILKLWVDATWREQKKDWTTFRINEKSLLRDLTAENELGKDEGKKWRFVDFDQYNLTIDSQTIPGVDQGLQKIYPNSGGSDDSGLVRELWVEGDSHSVGIFSGTDHPKIRIVFNPIKVGISDEGS